MAAPWVSRWSKIRRYVDFTIGDPPSEYEKRKVREYFGEFVQVKQQRDAYIYRPRDKAKLRAVQKHSRQGKRQWKVAFVPTLPGGKPEVRVSKRGRVTIREKGKGLSRRVHLFRDFEDYPGQTAAEPNIIAARILKRDKESRQFGLLTGKFESYRVESRGQLELLIAEAFMARAQGGSGATQDWCSGVVGYSFFNQSDFTEYRKARGLTGRDKRRKRRNRFKTKEDV